MRWYRFAMALIVASPALAQAPDPWLVVPDKSVGPITPKTTPPDLVRIFGAGNVKEEMVGPGGDAEAEPATVVNGKSPETSLVIFWDKLDKVGHHPDAAAHPAFISLCHANNLPAKKCKWHLAGGIAVGTSLRELEDLNGSSFTLAGFGWDYEGVVTDWKGGKLDSLLKGCGGVGLALQPGGEVGVPGSDTAKWHEQVSGDHEFPSNLPAMQALNPVVFSINVKFDTARNCPTK
jgi:hypothetical protein